MIWTQLPALLQQLESFNLSGQHGQDLLKTLLQTDGIQNLQRRQRDIRTYSLNKRFGTRTTRVVTASQISVQTDCPLRVLYVTCSFSLLDVRIMEATTSGSVSRGRLSNRRLNLATAGTDMSNIPNNYKHKQCWI